MPQRSTRSTPWTRMLDALAESNKALFAAIKSGNQRGYRLSRGLVSEVEATQRELADLRRKFARGPTDPRKLYETALDLARRAAGHSAELGKQVVGGAGEARQEAGETVGKIIEANRAAAQALAAGLQAAAKSVASRATRAPAARRAATRAKAARRTTAKAAGRARTAARPKRAARAGTAAAGAATRKRSTARSRTTSRSGTAARAGTARPAARRTSTRRRTQSGER